MVWIFYPESGFEPQFKNSKEQESEEEENEKEENEEEEKREKEEEDDKGWFEHHVTPKEYPALLEGLIRKESKRTPGKGVVFGKSVKSYLRLC